MSLRLFYVDDSGAESTRIVVFGWLELDVADWQQALRRWLDWRKELHAATGIAASYELHGTKFANGRGRPTGTDWDGHKAHRSEVMVEALNTIATLPGIRTGSVVHRAQPRVKYHKAKAQTYSNLVNLLDQRLRASGDLGMIIMDGDGTDPMYRATHRDLKLATRAIIEDPLFQGSHLSQWVQAADIVAYTAYMNVLREPAKKLMWDWYPTQLGANSSVTGPAPREL